jgi:glycosyltransferase involved in cell wall biosynthesis
LITPLVSVILPVYNAEKTLGAAIRSIAGQTLPDWELIIVNDGSIDNSLTIAQSFDDPRIRIVTDSHSKKLAARLNQAVSLCRGDYIARMDADDISYPDRLKTQVDFLQNNPQIDLVGSRVLIFSDDGEIVGTYPYKRTHEEICSRPWSGFYFPHPTWMGRREWFIQNPYNASSNKAQDQELLLRSYERSRFACLPEILLGYRKNELSIPVMLQGRYHFSRMLLRKAVSARRFFWALGLLEQVAKFFVEVFAVGTGLNYYILRHRALPISMQESLKWSNVWRSCK